MNVNLDHMTTEQLMLRDLIFEIPEFLRDASKESRDYQAGVFHALGLLQSKINSFDIDQSQFAHQLPDIEAWFLGGRQ